MIFCKSAQLLVPNLPKANKLGDILGKRVLVFLYNYCSDDIDILILNMRSDVKDLQGDLDRLNEWVVKWQMDFNRQYGIILHLHHNALENSGLYFCITWCILRRFSSITFLSQILSLWNIQCFLWDLIFKK